MSYDCLTHNMYALSAEGLVACSILHLVVDLMIAHCQVSRGCSQPDHLQPEVSIPGVVRVLWRFSIPVDNGVVGCGDRCADVGGACDCWGFSI